MLPGQSETPNPMCSLHAWIIHYFSSLCGSAATLRHLSGFDDAGVKGGEANLEKTQDLFCVQEV